MAAGLPSLNKISVGMPRTPYFVGVSGFLSMLTLYTSILPAISVDSSSTIGSNWRHGPHLSDQKSTNTGFVDFRTSCSKVLSDVSFVISFFTLPLFHYVGSSPREVKPQDFGGRGIK